MTRRTPPPPPDGAARGAELGAQLGRIIGARLGLAVERTTQGAEVAAQRTRETAGSTAAAARAGRDKLSDKGLAAAWQDVRAGLAPVGEVLEGVLEDARSRSAEAARVVAEQQQAKRWPWAVSVVLAGAGAGAALVLARRTLFGEDAPDAQEPGELQAVVDLLPGTPPATGAGPSDADPVSPP